MFYIYLAAVPIASFLLLTLYYNIFCKELRWNWSSIDLDDISYPDDFIWGTATASHQVEGNCINQWHEFEKGTNNQGSPNITNGQQSGAACEHWERYPEDI